MLGNIGNRLFLALGLSLAFFSFSMFGGLDVFSWCQSFGMAFNSSVQYSDSGYSSSRHSFFEPSLAHAWQDYPDYDLAAGDYPPPTDGYFLFDGYNIWQSASGSDPYLAFDDTDGVFSQWSVSWDYAARGTVNSILQEIPFMPEGLVSGLSATAQVVQTDYIVGMYRLLFYYFESTSGGLYHIWEELDNDFGVIHQDIGYVIDDSVFIPRIYDYLHHNGANNDGGLFGRLEVIRDRLVTMDSRLASISTNSAYLYDIKNNVTSIKSAVDSCKTYLYTCTTRLLDTYDRLGTMSANMIAKFNTLHDDLDDVETLLQGVIDALEDLSVDVNVSTDFEGDFDGSVTVTNWPYTASQYSTLYSRVISIAAGLNDLIAIGDDIYFLLNDIMASFNRSFDSAFIGDFSQLNAFSYGDYIARSVMVNYFPYSLIYFPYYFFDSLPEVTPLCPSVTVPLPVGLTGSSSLTVSLQQFESLRPVIHFTSMLLLLLALLFSTRKILFTGR